MNYATQYKFVQYILVRASHNEILFKSTAQPSLRKEGGIPLFTRGGIFMFCTPPPHNSGKCPGGTKIVSEPYVN